jgi:hypothetical protein
MATQAAKVTSADIQVQTGIVLKDFKRGLDGNEDFQSFLACDGWEFVSGRGRGNQLRFVRGLEKARIC